MALDPGIILSGRSADVASGLSSGIQMGGMLQQLQAAEAQEPIRNQLLQQQAQRGEMALQQAQAQSAEAEQNRRLGSIASTYSGIQGLVDSGKFNEAADTLEANKEVLRRSGITNFEDSDFAIEALRSGDAQAIRNVQLLGEQAVQVATERGIFGEGREEKFKASTVNLPGGISVQTSDIGRKFVTDADGNVLRGEEARAAIAQAESQDDAKTSKQVELDLKKSKDKFDRASKLRAEVRKATETFGDVEESFGRVRASQTGEVNAASDIALIFNFMKMLDPGSVVREGEFATAQNAAGVPDRVVNSYNRLLEGERLNPKQRVNFVKEAEKQFSVAEKINNRRLNEFEKLGKRFDLEREDIIVRDEDRRTGQPGVQDTGISVDEFRAMTPEQRAATIQRLQGR